MAAILAADVAGFSRLAGSDEDRTLARLRVLRADLIDPTFARHNGRIVKRMGDGILAEFRSVVEAVSCAVDLQNAMYERNEGLPADSRIDFRIGIHLGDVVEEGDGDLMGEGVNIAARLEGVSRIGGVCLSEDAYRYVRSRLAVEVADLGPLKLKNIAEPMRAYSLDVALPPKAPARFPARRSLKILWLLVVVGALAAAGLLYGRAGGARDGLPRTAGDRPAAHLSIVVLPFRNLSNDPDQDYFADGITESVASSLSHIRSSLVIARNTAFTYKGKSVDARQIGRELNVRYVLEGSVQRDAERVRVNAQLIDASVGAQLWADRFEESVSDLFRLEDRVVAQLSNSLGYQLVKAEAQKAARTKNPDVVDFEMRGWALVWRLSQLPLKDDCAAALAQFAQALKLDPDDASALAGKASARYVEYGFGWGGIGVDYDAEILGAAERAIAIAPDDVRAYLVKSRYLSASGRAREGLDVAEAAIAINPNDAHLLAARGFANIALGRFEEAARDFEPALLMSPRDPAVAQWRMSLGLAEFGLGHFVAATQHFQASINLGNQTFLPYGYLAAAYALAGDSDRASSALRDARSRNPRLTASQILAATPKLGRLAEGLAKAGLAAP